MSMPTADDVVAYFTAHPDDAVTMRDLIDEFAVDSDDRRGFRELMAALVDENKIVRLKSKLYKAKGSEPEQRPGWLVERRPAFRESGPAKRSDRPVNPKKSPLLPQVEATQAVGVLEHVSGRAMALVSSEEDTEYVPIVGDFTGLQRKEAAIWELTPKGAKLVEILGNPQQPKVEVLRLGLLRGFRATFSDEAIKAADKFNKPSARDLKNGREDLRHLPFVTIDGEDAKDFDDAVCAVREGSGFRLYVAIADVSHYVTPGSALDNEGFFRGTSVYFPGMVLPMLPPSLSDDLCSLRPDVERLAFVSEMHVDHEGRVSDEKSYKALFRSHARLTYNQVEAALHKGEDNIAKAQGEPLLVFAECSRALRAQKAKRGAIDLDMDEPMIVLDSSGRPKGSVARARLEAHRLIEDAMLAANSAIAREMRGRKLAAAYRIHESPNDDKLALVKEAAQSFGYRFPLPERPTAGQVAAFVRLLAQEERGKVLMPLVLRGMARARYSNEPLGHFALAEPDYLHFTSPIRRFPDLLVHRSLATKGADAPTDMARAALYLSEREQSAERASRDVNDYYRCLLAEPLVGEEFPAVVTGVMDFGAFVQIKEPYIEGLVPVRTMGDDYYQLDLLGIRLTGRRNGRSLALGDEISVRIKEVRMSQRKIELEWVQKASMDRASAGGSGRDFLARARERFGGRSGSGESGRPSGRPSSRGRPGGRPGARDGRAGKKKRGR